LDEHLILVRLQQKPLEEISRGPARERLQTLVTLPLYVVLRYSCQ